jgi:FkbM family methyltransferase
MKIIFQIDGGIGKSIVATAVCRAIKTQFPNDELLVITGYPEVFLCNPHVDRTFNFNTLNYFYQDHIAGHQVKMMLHNPYLETDFIGINGHLIEVWCRMFGIRYNGEMPELFLTNRELNFYAHNFRSEKPILLMQTNGGGGNQPNKYSWARDLPMSVAQKVVYAFANEYNVVHMRREDQLPLQGATPVHADFRALCVLIVMSTKRLFIDSFAQHAAAALGKPSTVCWIGNTPLQFGYALHTNVIAHAPTIKPELKFSVFSKYNIAGNATEFPYNSENEIFNADQIIELLRNDNRQVFAPSIQMPAPLNVESIVSKRLSHLRGVVDLGDVKQILDIGSWHLGESIDMAGLFPNAKVDAFEPVPDSYQLCLDNLGKQDDQKKSRIKVHNIALSDKEGDIPFYAIDPVNSSYPNVGASSLFKFKEGLNGTPFGQNLVQKEIMVKCDTLDGWCKKNKVKEVDIMWVDAQGAELLVFEGAKKILKSTKIIMTEVGLKPYYEGHTLKPDIDNLLIGLGFKELDSSFELNGFDYEANTIYIRSDN